MSFYNIRRMQLRFCCGHTKSPVRKYRLPATNTWITRTSIQMGSQFGGCPGNSRPHGQRASTRNTFRWNCCIENEGRGGVMPVTSAIDPTRRMIRQDPLEEFARALGCRVDELLLAGEPSHRHSLAMEFDPEEVTAAITARRPPLEESILRAQRAAVVPLYVLGAARQLVGKTTGRELAKLVIENAIATWHRDAPLASELRLPADAAARLQTLMSATRFGEESMKVPEEQSCWYQLNQVLTGERVFRSGWGG